MNPISRRLTSIIGLAAGIVVAILILSSIDLAAFIDALAAADYRFLIPSIVSFLLGLGTRAQRWRVLLAGKLPLSRAPSTL